jgi:dihydroorotate dehydrogenase
MMSFMFFLRIFHWFLLRLPPEPAHHLVIGLLGLLQRLPFRAAGKKLSSGPAVISIPGFSLRFPGRVGMAAGFDKNAQVFAALSRFGFGFVEVGTVTPKAQPGNPKPRIWRHGGNALVNHLGFNGCGLQVFRANILKYRNLVSVPLLANIGKGRETPNEAALEDYKQGIASLSDCVDGFVVNLSSPNTPGLFNLQSVAFLEGIAKCLPAGIPTWIKLSPDLENAELRELCDLINGESRFAGVVLTNTSRKLAESLVHAPQGGLSGVPLHERSLECVTIARERLKAPKVLIGVGGIFDAAGAKRMRAAGADLLEVYTGFIYRGPWLIRDLNEASV